jgi:hypothetical protein
VTVHLVPGMVRPAADACDTANRRPIAAALQAAPTRIARQTREPSCAFTIVTPLVGVDH